MTRGKYLILGLGLVAFLCIGEAQATPIATVTVTLSDHLGNTVTPINNVPVPGLTAYPGRHSFDARTAGASSHHDTRNIRTTYDGAPPVHYPIHSGWSEVHSQSWVPQVVGGWLRVATDGLNGQNNNVSWDQLFSAPYTNAVHEFDIRFSEGDPAANDKADGFGWKYVNSTLQGTGGAFYTNGEEPNLAGTLGVGFDIWDNNVVDNSANTSVSLHWNGNLIKTVNLQTEVSPAFSLETGEPIAVLIAVTVPEPSTLTMLALGLLGIMAPIRRRLRQVQGE